MLPMGYSCAHWAVVIAPWSGWNGAAAARLADAAWAAGRGVGMATTTDVVEAPAVAAVVGRAFGVVAGAVDAAVVTAGAEEVGASPTSIGSSSGLDAAAAGTGGDFSSRAATVSPRAFLADSSVGSLSGPRFDAERRPGRVGVAGTARCTLSGLRGGVSAAITMSGGGPGWLFSPKTTSADFLPVLAAFDRCGAVRDVDGPASTWR